jgi:hypothetical protein
MTSGLWPHIQEGSAAAVNAGVRVSERRSRLLGIDAPVVTKNELTGSLGVYAEKLAAERELFGKLDITQLEELAAESQALVDKAMAMVAAHARKTRMLLGVLPRALMTSSPASRPSSRRLERSLTNGMWRVPTPLRQTRRDDVSRSDLRG